MDLIRRNIDIILILTVGFLLRFTISFTHSYSNDELSAVNRLRYDNFSELIQFGVQQDDMHPAGVQVFMKGWSLLVGKSELAMRFPFVLFGTAAILVLFLMGKKWFNRKVGLIAATLLAVLYFPIMNSEFARPYSPGLLISLLVGWYFYKILIEKTNSWKDTLILGCLFAAGMYTHYFAFLFVGFIGLTGLFYVKKETLKYYLVAGGLGILLFLPHIGITEFHLNVGGLQWLAEPGPDWLFQFLFHAFNASWVVVIGIIILLIWAFILPKKDHPQSRNVLLITSWFFGIFLVGFILSYVSTPVLKFPVMLFAFPFFLLLVGVLLARIPRTKMLLIGLSILGLTSTIWEKDLYGNKHFALFKEVGIQMAEWNQKYGAENIYTIYNLNNPDYINFYKAEWGGKPLDFDWNELTFNSDVPIRTELMNRSEEYCVVGYSARVTLVQVFETVREFYPEIVAYERFNNGSIFLMKKGHEKGRNPLAIRFSTFKGKVDDAGWQFDEGQLTQSAQYLLDENHRYGPTFEFKTDDLPELPNPDLGSYLKVIIRAEMPADGKLTVYMTGERDGEIIQHRDENMWIGHDLEVMINSSADKEGYFAFKIPSYSLPTDKLQILLWNRGDTPVRIDRFEIHHVENIFN